MVLSKRIFPKLHLQRNQLTLNNYIPITENVLFCQLKTTHNFGGKIKISKIELNKSREEIQTKTHKIRILMYTIFIYRMVS